MLDLALTKQELIKVHVLKSIQASAPDFLPTLIKRLKADLVQSIGHRVILYRPNPTQPRIQFPK
jgi:RNA-binding protein